MAVPLTTDQIRQYAQRRGQAVTLVEPKAAALAMAHLGTPAKALRARDGQKTVVALVYDGAAGRLEARLDE